MIKCTTTQTHEGSILYTDVRKLGLIINQPAPLFLTETSTFGIITGAMGALLLVICIVIIVLVFVSKKKKRVNSSNESISKYRPESKDPVQSIIWKTKISKHTNSGTSLVIDRKYSRECYVNEDGHKQHCKADIHYSSSSSSSTSSRQAPVSSTSSFTSNLSARENLQGDLVSFSPAYMYTETCSQPPKNPGDNPYQKYQPKRLGHFDLSTDIHMFTRPNTEGNFQNIQHIYHQCVYSPMPPKVRVRPFHTLKIHASDLTVVAIDPQDGEAVLQSCDVASVGGASVISVFDCHHGCFSPDHSMSHCHQHQDLDQEEMQQENNKCHQKSSSHSHSNYQTVSPTQSPPSPPPHIQQ